MPLSIKIFSWQGGAPRRGNFRLVRGQPLKAVRTLVEAGADPKIAAPDGTTALSLAESWGRAGSSRVPEVENVTPCGRCSKPAPIRRSPPFFEQNKAPPRRPLLLRSAGRRLFFSGTGV
ncbi:hypothetical protein HMPREF7215_1290 [Pyramidobacter piscolens W5455]|uniref:Ankyrin repeat protein n=1 Tax=Pyramidobacter piscolens W5455 TaxID=352165 RepID=A0ABP2HTB6_9BACT|nr:hypothetical protein [Pyramidobacter piscolens]EFB90206.1 hypothetical protein HMPREF7215_1290 [Pyramidobacter piscolens W5455]